MSLTKEQEAVFIDRLNRFTPPIGVEATGRGGRVLEQSINSLGDSIMALYELMTYLSAAALPEYSVVNKK